MRTAAAKHLYCGPRWPLQQHIRQARTHVGRTFGLGLHVRQARCIVRFERPGTALCGCAVLGFRNFAVHLPDEFVQDLYQLALVPTRERVAV